MVASDLYSNVFRDVHAAEIDWINQRRPAGEKLSAPPKAQLDVGATGGERQSIMAHEAPVQGAGIALSGGGIRSAAFSLGALQAIDQALGDEKTKSGGVHTFDYISSVSGGGYIAASLRLGMEKLSGGFPFASQAGDRRDNDAVGHIRNHSRYLIPGGAKDVLACVAVVLRGLAANMMMVLAVLLLAAGVTGLFNPNQEAFRTPDILGWEGFTAIQAFGEFAYTKLLLLVGFLILLAWGLQRSFARNCGPEFRGALYNLTLFWLCATAICAFLELQPFAVRGLFQLYGGDSADTYLGSFATFISKASPVVAPLAAIFAYVSRSLGDTIKTNSADPHAKAIATVISAKAVVFFVAIALPLMIWIAYLHITLLTDIGFLYRPAWLSDIVTRLCGSPDPTSVVQNLGQPGTAARIDDACKSERLIGWMFAMTGGLLFLIVMLHRPNANSLHRLYRDRLSTAFLFDPGSSRPAADHMNPKECGDTTLHSLRSGTGPLPLINCALNVQGSERVNRRGRNADFFFFSPVYCGSSSTGFVRSDAASEAMGVEFPDIGTAIAISGAAASSNMGTNTVWGMAPTLALLNIRLGFWLANPMRLATGRIAAAPLLSRLRSFFKFYMISEMFGQLDEKSSQIYLTDGGHIENLGLYELLRRRLRTIVVIDAEADPNMAFSSLVAAQRFARIDLGVRIELPWQAIRDSSLSVNKSFAAGETFDLAQARLCPHVATGIIDYGDEKGRLIYVKASMTGDENDYIMDYKRRHGSFPHETTGDQFFSEEQFEVYRALGFHALHSAFERKSRIAEAPEEPRDASSEAPPESNQHPTELSSVGGDVATTSSSRTLRDMIAR